jgi:hypothetical protein
MTRIAHERSPITGFPHLFIAMPTTGAYSPPTTFSLARSTAALAQAGIAFDLYMMDGNCHVDDARNGCLRDFMQTDCTDLVFIDSDVGWSPDDLVKLANYVDYDIVAGVYPKKTPAGMPVEYPFVPIHGETVDPATGLLRVARVPTGFMKVRRYVIETLMEKNRARSWVGQHESPDQPPYVEVFRRDFIPRQGGGRERLSGDYFFCHQWTEAGGHVYVCPDIHFAHEGAHEWTGRLGDHLRDKAGVPHPSLIEGVERLRSGLADAETFALLFEGWRNPYAATVEQLYALYHMAIEARGPILETGSGLSTLVLAIATEARPERGPSVYSLEHDPDYMAKTAKLCHDFALDNVALVYAPLQEFDKTRDFGSVKEGEYTWYGISEAQSLEMPDEFSIVFCDGPQGRFGRMGLFERGRGWFETATIVIDDADRDLALIQSYAKEWGREVQTLGKLRTFAVLPLPVDTDSPLCESLEAAE